LPGVKLFIQVDAPDLFPAGAGVPAVQVPVATESVEVSPFRVILRRRGGPGVSIFVSAGVPAIPRTLIRYVPEWLASVGLKAADMVAAALPAHHIKPVANDQR
jgi:hypothetical protein